MTEFRKPQQNPTLFGHEAEEAEILRAFASGKAHHAWLVSGPKGIGKATLAYRMARWVLDSPAAARKPEVDTSQQGLFGELLPEPVVETPAGLAIDETSHTFTQIAEGSHPDLLVISEEQPDEDGKVKQEISVDEVRRVGHFLSLTSSQSGWRVVIVDSADNMNRNAANALLKLLEEPPSQALFILVSHAPGRLLPTIRSRCRFLKLHPLADQPMKQVLSAAAPDINDAQLRFAATVAPGSPGLALEYSTDAAREMYGVLLSICRKFPALDIQQCLEMVQQVISKSDPAAWHRFGYLLQHLIAGTAQGSMTGIWQPEAVSGEAEVKKALASKASLDKWADVWEKVNRMMVDVNRVNMDKRHTAICMLEAVKSVAA